MVPDHLVIYVDSLNRAKFFSCFIPLFEQYHITYRFVTHRLSAYRLLPKDRTLLLRNIRTERECRDYAFLQKSLSVLNNYHTFDEAVQIANDIWAQLKELKIDMMWIWNGTTTIERALGEYAKSKGIRTRYFEISNIENRIFIDPCGISGESILLKKPEILDGYVYDETAFLDWQASYREKKKERGGKLKSKIPGYVFTDFAGYLIYDLIREDRRNPLKLVQQRVSNNFVHLPFDEVDMAKKYILLPLQVGNDSQIKLYSNYSNEAVIREALTIARKEHAALYIKPHPREEDAKEIETIKHFLKEQDVFLVNGDLFELIENAHKVVINNSTVGLEAKIFDKEVAVFGDAYYKYFDKERVRKYIMGYLPNIVYPESEIGEEMFLKIFEEIT